MAEERPGAQQWVPERPSLSALRTAVQDCRGCELYRDATQAVMGGGRRDSSLVLLGEQPGDLEDQRGEPFVGPAGKVLDRALAAAGVDPAAACRTNVVKHFRWSTNRDKRRIHQTPPARTSPPGVAGVVPGRPSAGLGAGDHASLRRAPGGGARRRVRRAGRRPPRRGGAPLAVLGGHFRHSPKC